MVQGEEIDLPNKAHPEYDHLRQPELLTEDLRYTWAGGSASRAKAPEAALTSAVSNILKANFPGPWRQGMAMVREKGRRAHQSCQAKEPPRPPSLPPTFKADFSLISYSLISSTLVHEFCL